MSADNGIYILQTNGENGFEYRVAHLQAIENLYYSDPSGDEIYMWLFFRNAPRFFTKELALLCAQELETEILNDDFCPILEYGVSILEVNKKFPSERPMNEKSVWNDYSEDDLNSALIDV